MRTCVCHLDVRLLGTPQYTQSHKQVRVRTQGTYAFPCSGLTMRSCMYVCIYIYMRMCVCQRVCTRLCTCASTCRASIPHVAGVYVHTHTRTSPLLPIALSLSQNGTTSPLVVAQGKRRELVRPLPTSHAPWGASQSTGH